MSTGRIEILVEPFKEGDPGPHVLAVLKVLDDDRFEVEMGPFSTIAEGSLDELRAVVGQIHDAGFGAGATSIQTRLERL